MLRIIGEKTNNILINVNSILTSIVVLLLVVMISCNLNINKINKISVVDIIKGYSIKVIKKVNIVRYIGAALLIAYFISVNVYNEIIVDNSTILLGTSIVSLSMAVILFIPLINKIIISIIGFVCGIFGGEIKILVQEIKYNGNRLAQSVIMLALIVAMGVISNTMSTSIKNEIGKLYKGADLIVSVNNSNADDAEEKINSIGDIKTIKQDRTAAKVNSTEINISGVNPKEYFESSSEIFANRSKEDTINKLSKNEKYIVITSTLKKKLNVDINDTILIGLISTIYIVLKLRKTSLVEEIKY